jgi:hypothetical protein
MTSVSKLRVATLDVTDALCVVTAEVEKATGFAAQPVLQEVDGADLVVEVQLADSNAAVPDHLALAVERSTRDLDVLSTWKEQTIPPGPAPLHSEPEIVFSIIDGVMPEAAHRALRDEVPTAQWLPTGEDEAGGDRSYWILAVPSLRPNDLSIVGTWRRRGYALRFSGFEAEAARRALAS